MRLFAIDADNTITAFPAAEQIPEGQEQFASEKELAKLAANWPADRVVQVWNSFAGVAGFGADLKPVKKFTDRKTAIKRIWAAIQKLAEIEEMDEQRTRIRDAEAKLKAARAKLDVPATPEASTTAQETATAAPKAAKGAPKKAKATKAARTKDGASVPREFSKKAIVLEMLRRKEGATLAEIGKATDWQKHSIRGFISGTITKKMGLTVESTKREDGERVYKLA